METKLCCICSRDISDKRKSAKYCSDNCRAKGNYSSDKNTKYFSTLAGKAKRLWLNARTRCPENFSLQFSTVYSKLENGICEVTGLPFIYTSEKSRGPWIPSLDKINPNEGYTEENTRVVCWIYNTAKNVYTDEDVLVLAEALVSNSDGSLKSQASKRERRK